MAWYYHNLTKAKSAKPNSSNAQLPIPMAGQGKEGLRTVPCPQAIIKSASKVNWSLKNTLHQPHHQGQQATKLRRRDLVLVKDVRTSLSDPGGINQPHTVSASPKHHGFQTYTISW